MIFTTRISANSLIIRIYFSLDLPHISTRRRMQLKERPNRIHRALLHAELTAIERNAAVWQAINESLVSEV